MEKGKTLWEMVRDRISNNGSNLSFYNPLDHKIGSFVAVNKTEFAGFDFYVREIRENTRRIGHQDFQFVDYVLVGVNTKSFDKVEEVTLRLRVMPNAVGSRDALLLQLYDDLAYAQGLHDVVRDTTGKFEVTDDESGQVDLYFRVNDVLDPYETAVLVVKATADDGKAISGQVEHARLEYWDYWRDVDNGASKTFKQFLFVEMNLDTGWFQIWSGEEFFL